MICIVYAGFTPRGKLICAFQKRNDAIYYLESEQYNTTFACLRREGYTVKRMVMVEDGPR
uniref:Uncharacterized protein n=1 Tax=viral metagenome TaxID=1070528 RepID=A0A6M3IN27_9ZZZZ